MKFIVDRRGEGECSSSAAATVSMVPSCTTVGGGDVNLGISMSRRPAGRFVVVVVAAMKETHFYRSKYIFDDLVWQLLRVVGARAAELGRSALESYDSEFSAVTRHGVVPFPFH